MQVSPSHIVQELLWLRIRNVLRPTAEWMQGLLYLPPQYLYFGLDPFIFFSPFLTCSRTIFLLVKYPPPPLILCSLERRAVYSALSTTGIYILLFLIPSLPPACLHTCFTVSFFLYFLFSSCLFLPFISAPPPPYLISSHLPPLPFHLAHPLPPSFPPPSLSLMDMYS